MKNIFIKRLKIMSIIIVMAMFVANIKNNNTKEDTISTMSVPVTNKVIVIDAGHGRRRWRSGK